MMLRSSSSSVVQMLLLESPKTEINYNHHRHSPRHDHCHTKVKLFHGVPHLKSFSCNSSPAHVLKVSDSGRKDSVSHGFIRRAQSESNLEGLVLGSPDLEEVYRVKVQNRVPPKNPHSTMLHSEPSFSIYSTDDKGSEGCTDNQELKVDGDQLVKSDGQLERSDTICSGEFSFVKKMGLIEEIECEEEVDDEKKEEPSRLMMDLKTKEENVPANPSEYLAAGLGVYADRFGGDFEGFTPKGFDESGDIGEYYKRRLREEPSNPLLLRNYAQFLQGQEDLSGAEEYYIRATLADPNDGEILMQYARLVWDLHHDRDKASSYFERAVSAASEDSHVQAAYAKFLWETGDSDEEDGSTSISIPIEETGNQADSASIEEYYKRMIEENPHNPLFLRNYAEFLYQSKGDLEGAEEYYARATLADPRDGEIISQYAKLVWKLHQDRDKAILHFERAVQASPDNSNVLAAYARFLWEAEDDDEEENTHGNHDQVPTFLGSMTTSPTESALITSTALL